MRILLAAICGFVLDLILGDPEMLTPIHPVVLMGRCITVLESLLRKYLPKTRRGELLGGTMLALTLPLGTLLICCLVLMLLERLWPPLAFLIECIWCWQALAVKNLRDEAMRVYRTLKDGTAEDSRAAVSRIVGRDTKALDRSGVTRATVETVAENFSDGIAAPMLLQPKVLLADEPTSALDVSVRKQVVEEVLSVREHFGTTIILVTHNIGVIGAMADRVLVMRSGEMVEFGDKEQILNHPQADYTKRLMAAVPRLVR